MLSNQSNPPESEKLMSNDCTSPDKAEEAFAFYDVINGFQLSQVVYVATKLGVADFLKDNAKSAKELANGLKADEKVLRHVLQVLANQGMVTVNKNGNYQLTQLGSRLRSDVPDSLQCTILNVGFSYRYWGNLLHAVQTGTAGFNKTFQMGVYEYLEQNPEDNENFSRWMEETGRDWLLPALDKYDFSKFTHIMDLGGCTGTLTVAILKKYPDLQGVIFDRKQMLNGTKKILASAGVGERCQIIGGDFFDAIPAGSDLYIISRVLLNWNDVDALKILRNCRAAMDTSATLLIMDVVLPDKEATTAELLMSLYVFMFGGYLLRTVDEYCELLSNAGFQSSRVMETGGVIRFIEAAPK